MGISDITGIGGSATTATATKNTGTDARQEFLDYMAKSPEERMQEAWLKAHGISKEEFDKMTAQEKKALMDQMKKEMVEQMRDKAEKRTKIYSSIL